MQGHDINPHKMAVMVSWSSISEIPATSCKVFLLDSKTQKITDGIYNTKNKQFMPRDVAVEFDYWMEAPNDFSNFVSFTKDSMEVITFNDKDDIPVAVLSGFNLKASYNFHKMKDVSEIESLASGITEMIYEDIVNTLKKAVE